MWFRSKGKSRSETPVGHAAGLLCFDLDGTMVDPESEPRFHPNLTDRLLKLERAGFLWAVATGRSFEQAMDALARYGVARAPHVLIAREYEIYLRSDRGGWIGARRWNRVCAGIQRRFLRSNRRAFRRWGDELATEFGAEMFVEPEDAGVVASGNPEMDQICDWLLRKGEEEMPTMGFQRNGRYLRFTAKGLGKGSAVEEMCRVMGVPLARVFVAGDSHNDLSMIELPGVGSGCPSNAIEEVREMVRQKGGFVATQRASAGMIEVVDQLYAGHLDGDPA